jgi:hypothetical protein
MHLWAYGFLGFAEDFFAAAGEGAFLMPARFCQDSLENLFGQIRQVGGTATNPNQLAAARALNTVENMKFVKQTRKGSYTGIGGAARK